MTFNEVMECTPRYFDALCQRWRDEIERAERAQEFMLAQLTAAVCNFSFAGCKQPKKPKDFMPSEWREEAKNNPVTKPRKLTKKAKEKRQHEFGEQLRKTMMSAFGDV